MLITNEYRKDINSALGRGLIIWKDELKKLLLHPVNVNAGGNNIPGILTHVRADHITLVGESHLYVIPLRHVIFICYNSKAEG